MSAFLTDTLVWTGVLIALVLLIRRPMAQLFGAKAAYALWALPMARLLLPPLVLPAWMAPEPDATLDMAFDPAGALSYDGAMVATVSNQSHTLAAAQVEPPAFMLGGLASFDWTSAIIPLWIVGAAVFLVRRYALYFEMRRELLGRARPMGEAGRVRLVETPDADGPVAFGVIDKVIALPPGFMAGRDRAARDLALAHELAHHRGHDLLCNMLVQPLFALHWFNPLAALGWRALRRDQEAACDARVIARQPRESRVAYATVIARFATQPRTAARLALAAPMACPVLGDRSIVQRLRSLSMNEISRRRRWSGRLLIGAAALALPLTGSISYAQSEPVAPPAPPEPPAAPLAVEAPLPPAAPQAPEAPRVMVDKDGKRRIVRIERVVRDDARKHADEDRKDIRKEHRIVLRDGHRMSAEDRAEFEREMAEMRAELHRELGENGELQRELRRELGEHGELSRELKKEFGEHGEFQREMRIAIASANADARAAVRNAPRVTVRCRDGQKEVTETVVANDGRQRIFVCKAAAMADARKAIAEARAEVARTRGLSDTERAEALRSLDEAERSTRAD